MIIIDRKNYNKKKRGYNGIEIEEKNLPETLVKIE